MMPLRHALYARRPSDVLDGFAAASSKVGLMIAGKGLETTRESGDLQGDFSDGARMLQERGGLCT